VSQIRYEFKPIGSAEVIASFESIEAAAIRHSKVIGRSAGQATAAQAKAVGGYRTSARAGVEAQDRATRDADRARKQAEKDEERSIKKRQDYERRQRATHFANLHKAEEKARREQQRRTERAERERIERTARMRSSAMGMVGAAALGGAVALGAAGAALVGAGTRRATNDRETARRLAINARGAGEAMVDPSQLHREASAVAMATPGQTAGGILAAQQKFVGKTGDLGKAREFAGVFATVANATGTGIEDIAAAGAELFAKFNVKTVDEMSNALAKLAMQGKSGTFELSDAASQFARMGAAAQRFGGEKGAAGVAELGAFSQIAAKSTGSPEQAATAVEATLRQLLAQRGKLRAMGVDPLDKKGQGRALSDVLPEVVAKVGGKDLGAKKQKLQQLFGDEGVRALSPFIDEFGNALKENRDPLMAMKDMMKSFVDAAGDYDDMLIDSAAASKDASAQMTLAWETISSKLSERMVPMIEHLAEALSSGEFDGAIDALVGTAENLMGAFEALVDVIAKIPGFERKTVSPEEQRAADQKELSRVDRQIKNDMRRQMAENKDEGVVGPVQASPELVAKRKMLEERIAKSDKEIEMGQRFNKGALSQPELQQLIAENPASADFLQRQQKQAEGVDGWKERNPGLTTKIGDSGTMVPPELQDAARTNQTASKAFAEAVATFAKNAATLGGDTRGAPDGGAGRRF